eukprot:1146900-Pelagomonas_calceolata.AAC.1
MIILNAPRFICKKKVFAPQVGASKIQHGNPDPCPKQAEGFCLGRCCLPGSLESRNFVQYRESY